MKKRTLTLMICGAMAAALCHGQGQERSGAPAGGFGGFGGMGGGMGGGAPAGTRAGGGGGMGGFGGMGGGQQAAPTPSASVIKQLCINFNAQIIIILKFYNFRYGSILFRTSCLILPV